jgi:hypothetical protein
VIRENAPSDTLPLSTNVLQFVYPSFQQPTILEVGGRDLCRVHVTPSAFPVDAEVTEADKNGQHKKKTAFYGRFGNGTREIPDPEERNRYRLHVWGP